MSETIKNGAEFGSALATVLWHTSDEQAVEAFKRFGVEPDLILDLRRATLNFGLAIASCMKKADPDGLGVKADVELVDAWLADNQKDLGKGKA